MLAEFLVNASERFPAVSPANDLKKVCCHIVEQCEVTT